MAAEMWVCAPAQSEISTNLRRPIPQKFSQFARRAIGWLASAKFGPGPTPPASLTCRATSPLAIEHDNGLFQTPTLTTDLLTLIDPATDSNPVNDLARYCCSIVARVRSRSWLAYTLSFDDGHATGCHRRHLLHGVREHLGCHHLPQLRSTNPHHRRAYRVRGERNQLSTGQAET